MTFPPEVLKSCWFLAGPTASGKSETGVALAERIGAEILSLDSMSVYRGMDVGTAKPSQTLQQRVPHHLINLVDPSEEFSLAEYVELAEKTCRQVLDREKTPLFVGGTGLYLRGILRGVFEGPPAQWEYRRELQKQAKSEGPGSVHRLLREVDPVAAANLHPNDTRRIIRALEVFHATGRPLSEQQQQGPLPGDRRPPHVYWLSPPRDWLYARINARVEAMIEAGLIEEVQKLLSADRPLSRTAAQALGYKEVVDYLNRQGGLVDCVEQIQTHTRQFAKRQHTWFRNLEECKPVEMTGRESPEELAERILGNAERGT